MSVPQLLSVRNAAAVLSCSPDHVYDLIAAQRLRKVDIGLPGPKHRPKTRVRLDDLEAYIAAGGSR